jgi:assimilatory nitrate reductase catalytic subunit|tara:strand:- start:977 stop:3700 length:2724 start_codon:yes stop_codon:yes gene_type:complete
MDLATTCTTCPYCGVGCGVVATVKDERLIAVAGDPSHPANQGRLCVKGSTLVETQGHESRMLVPSVDGVDVDWSTATREVADRFMKIIDQHGPDSVAFYLSGQLLTEDYYVANKLMKGFVGSGNVDTNSRLCMASAVAAHKRAFGEDIVACDYEDLDTADLIVLVGSNAAWTHPVAYQRIVNAVKNRGTEVVVIDPRSTSSCDIATLHLALKPGSDVALFNGLLTYLNQNDLCDHDFIEMATDNVENCFQAAQLSIIEVSAATHLPIDLVTRFYECFGGTRKTVTIFSQGVNQSVAGTDKCNAIINCHLATGRIGIKGAGPFSITGQPNAMGGREVGGMANQLAAHMDFTTQHIAAVQEFWGARNIATAPGAKAVDLFDKMALGEIKAVWIMATNPAVSLPDTAQVKKALTRCELVVVSDTVQRNDTLEFADIMLPARGWGEKDGTVTNSERCISRQRQVLPAPVSARADWQIITDVAHAMGFQKAFAFESAYEIFKEHAALSGHKNSGKRLFDISSLADISKTEYDELQPFTWPIKKKPFEDNRFSTASGRAFFVAVTPGVAAQATNAEYPLVLNTGRLRDQWHTMTRTGTSSKLFAHQSQPLIEVSLSDAEQYGVNADDLIQLSSRQGSLVSRVKVTETLQPGQLFMPIHWNEQFASTGSVGQLFSRAVDPISGQPELKHAAVKFEPVKTTCWARVFSQETLPRSSLMNFQYWVRKPVADGGWEFECAIEESDETNQGGVAESSVNSGIVNKNSVFKSIASLQAQLKKLFPGCHIQNYRDSVSQVHRCMGFHAGKLIYSLVSGPSLSELTSLSLPYQLIPEQSQWRGLTNLAGNRAAASPLVCTCFEVTKAEIESALEMGSETLSELGKALKCGTNCGSCVPEINQLIRQHTKTAEQNRYQEVAR